MEKGWGAGGEGAGKGGRSSGRSDGRRKTSPWAAGPDDHLELMSQLRNPTSLAGKNNSVVFLLRSSFKTREN